MKYFQMCKKTLTFFSRIQKNRTNRPHNMFYSHKTAYIDPVTIIVKTYKSGLIDYKVLIYTCNNKSYCNSIHVGSMSEHNIHMMPKLLSIYSFSRGQTSIKSDLPESDRADISTLQQWSRLRILFFSSLF